MYQKENCVKVYSFIHREEEVKRETAGRACNCNRTEPLNIWIVVHLFKHPGSRVGTKVSMGPAGRGLDTLLTLKHLFI